MLIATAGYAEDIVRRLKQGWEIRPLAGTISRDGYIFRHCLLTSSGQPHAIVSTETFEALKEAGIFQKCPRTFTQAPAVEISAFQQKAPEKARKENRGERLTAEAFSS